MPTYNYIVKKELLVMKKSFYEYSQTNNNGENANQNGRKSFQNQSEHNNLNQKQSQQTDFSNQNSNSSNQSAGFSRQNNTFSNQGFGGQNSFNNQNGFSNQNSDFLKNQNMGKGSNTEKVEDTLNKYKNMSQGDLLSNLYSEVAKQKQQGTFDARRLENAISSLGGLLTPEQQKNMKEMLNKLK